MEALNYLNQIQFCFIFAFSIEGQKNIMSTQVYVQNSDGTYSPINLVPSNQIKCVQCDQFHPISEIQLHAQTHISPKFSHSKPTFRHKKIEKVDITKNIDANDGEGDITIRSVSAVQLPKLEQKRKNVKQIQSSNQRVQINQMDEYETQVSDKVSIFMDDLDYSCQQEQVEHERKLDLNQKVEFGKQKKILKEKFLNFYENNKQNTQLSDHHQELRKQKKQFLGKKQIVYEISSIPIEQKKPTKQKNSTVYKLQLKPKNPKAKMRISTSSSFYVKNDQKPQQRQAENLECPSCHGFYCQTCRSTIPPQYRPSFRESELFKGEETRLTGTGTRSTFFRKEACRNCEFGATN